MLNGKITVVLLVDLLERQHNWVNIFENQNLQEEE